MTDAFTEPELALLHHAQKGHVLDLDRRWGPARVLRGSMVRQIVARLCAGEHDARGLRLRNARIAGPVDLSFMTGLPLLDFGDCFFDSGLDLRGADMRALRMWGTVIEGGSAPALIADRITVRHSVMFSRGFLATSSSSEPTVSLSGATIGGQLSLSDAHLCNHGEGTALRAIGVDIGQSVLVNDGATAASSSARATLEFLGAQVGGQFSLTNATILNRGSGGAMDATSARIHHDVVMKSLWATSSGAGPVLSLSTALVGGCMDVADVSTPAATGPAILADGARIDHDLILGTIQPGVTSTDVGISVRDVRVGGSISIADEATRALCRLGLDGLRFESLPDGSVTSWLRILADRTPAYAPQPYQHLALAAQRAGNDQDVRAVRISQRRDQLQRATRSRWERAWGRVTYVTLGYGYRPWLALIWLLGVVGASVLLTVALASGLTVPDTDGHPCSGVDQFLVSLEQSLPLVDTGVAERCAPNSTTTGQVLAALSPAVQLLAWGFATLFVAGFTGAVRKT